MGVNQSVAGKKADDQDGKTGKSHRSQGLPEHQHQVKAQSFSHQGRNPCQHQGGCGGDGREKEIFQDNHGRDLSPAITQGRHQPHLVVAGVLLLDEQNGADKKPNAQNQKGNGEKQPVQVPEGGLKGHHLPGGVLGGDALLLQPGADLYNVPKFPYIVAEGIGLLPDIPA